MKIQLILLSIFITVGYGLYAQKNEINLEKEISHRDFTEWCIIIDYSKDGELKFRSINSEDTLISKIRSMQKAIDISKRISGLVPLNNDTVLIIMNKKEEIVLMAKEWDALYFRLWSPDIINAKFKYKRPSMNLEDSREYISSNFSDNYYTCVDGCLCPKRVFSDSLKLRFSGPRDLFIDSINRFSVKISVYQPMIGTEFKLYKNITVNSTLYKIIIHDGKFFAKLDYHSPFHWPKPYLNNEIRYYYYPSKMLELKINKFSGYYASLTHVYSLNKEDIKQNAYGVRVGAQAIFEKYLYCGYSIGYLSDFKNLNKIDVYLNFGICF